MSRIQSQKGQGTVEMVLLLAITVAIGLLVTNYLEQSKFAQKLFGDPWHTLSGMIECGSWAGCGKGQHPNSVTRVLSLAPNE